MNYEAVQVFGSRFIAHILYRTRVCVYMYIAIRTGLLSRSYNTGSYVCG